jgi:hypothetical protein
MMLGSSAAASVSSNSASCVGTRTSGNMIQRTRSSCGSDITPPIMKGNMSHRRLCSASGSTDSSISSWQTTRCGSRAWCSSALSNCARVMLGSTTP